MPFVFLGWLWAWWCDPSEMMRQRRQRLALKADRKPTHVTRMNGSPQDGWDLTCTCGWHRKAFKTLEKTGEARTLLDQHEERFRGRK